VFEEIRQSNLVQNLYILFSALDVPQRRLVLSSVAQNVAIQTRSAKRTLSLASFEPFAVDFAKGFFVAINNRLFFFGRFGKVDTGHDKERHRATYWTCPTHPNSIFSPRSNTPQTDAVIALKQPVSRISLF
jgi:hypothetical protein